MDGGKFDFNTKAEAVLAGNLWHIEAFAGKKLYGDWRLNVMNAAAAEAYYEMGFAALTLSLEAPLSEIRAAGIRSAEVVAYGRAPLMLIENCVIRSALGKCDCQNHAYALLDRKGERLPLLARGCKNILLNPRPLYMADRMDDLKTAGAACARLCMTTETPEECQRIISLYFAGLRGEKPRLGGNFTRGRLYK
jgi:putative protease